MLIYIVCVCVYIYNIYRGKYWWSGRRHAARPLWEGARGGRRGSHEGQWDGLCVINSAMSSWPRLSAFVMSDHGGPHLEPTASWPSPFHPSFFGTPIYTFFYLNLTLSPTTTSCLPLQSTTPCLLSMCLVCCPPS